MKNLLKYILKLSALVQFSLIDLLFDTYCLWACGETGNLMMNLGMVSQYYDHNHWKVFRKNVTIHCFLAASDVASKYSLQRIKQEDDPPLKDEHTSKHAAPPRSESEGRYDLKCSALSHWKLPLLNCFVTSSPYLHSHN